MRFMLFFFCLFDERIRCRSESSKEIYLTTRVLISIHEFDELDLDQEEVIFNFFTFTLLLTIIENYR